MLRPPKRMKVTGPNQPKKIWIVDDKEAIRKMIAIALWEKNKDLDIRTFSSVDTVKEALIRKESPPNVLLTDYQMPGENGIELANYFRNEFPRTTVVLMSGTPELISTTSIESSGIKKILKKPFYLPELNEILNL